MKIALSLVALCLITINAFSTNFSGTYTIGGAGSDYSTITAAMAALKNTSNTVTGNCVFELKSDYNPASETYPILIKQFIASNPSYTVTFRPQTGVGSIVNQVANTTAVLSLDSADKYIFDGRAGGSGASVWTFRNTRTSTFAPTIRLLNGATGNSLIYLTVESQSTTNTVGDISILGTVNTTANSNNTIDNCILRNRSDIGANNHATGIYAAGSLTYFNSNNTISNCEFFNHFHLTSNSYAVFISTGNTDFTITNNKIYQPSALTPTTGNYHMGIRVNSTGNNFTITNNSIGYANASGTGTTTYSGNYAIRYVGIYLTLGTTTASSIQNNRIANFDITTTATNASSAYGAFSGIYLTEGKANIGNITGNYIGDTATGSNIIITKNIDDRSNTIIQGIGSTSTSTVNISNNSIGGFTIIDGDDSTNMAFYGICTAGSNANYTIEYNKIGSYSNSNNILLGQSGFSKGGQRVYSIYNTATGTIALNNNVVKNITSYGTGSYPSFGIYTSGGVCTINNNIISDFKNYSTLTNGTALPAMIGISKNIANSGTQSINNNYIYNLSVENTATANVIVGIYATGPVASTLDIKSNRIYNLTLATSVTNSLVYGLYVNNGSGVVENNFIHSLSLNGSSANIYGIRIVNGDHNYQKNILRLGIDGSGSNITAACSVFGMYKTSSLNLSNKFYFNTIYIGGTGVGSTAINTAAFYRNAAATVDYVQNNIFVNNRSNSTTGGYHYCYILNGTTGANFDYNVYFASGTGGNVASINNGTTARLTLKAVRENFILQELHSGYGNPSFVDATGNSSAVDLHISGTSPVEASGIAIAGITDDFDGNTLTSYTPTDIGADAGNFTQNDVFTPNISYSDLSNTSSFSNITLSNVTISDFGTGVPTTGSSAPRIWYRISTTPVTTWKSNTGTLSSGTGNDGVWSFVIDYSKLSRAIVTNDRIQYYIVAEDQASTANVWTTPFIGASHIHVDTQTTAPTTPKSYLISGTGLSGNYNIGTGGDYTSLTGTGGFFAAVNATTVSGDITLTIISNLTETGANGLNQFSTSPSGSSFTLTMVPSTNTERLISCSSNNAMIKFLGIDSFTIDGSYSGSGKYLRFRNTNGTNNTFNFQNASRYNTIKNCIIEGPANSYVINFSTSPSAATGNTNNKIENCEIRDRSDIPGIPSACIYSNGTGTVGLENKDNTITNCEIYNFASNGIIITGVGNAGGWTITDNHFYNTSGTSALSQISINLQSTNTLNNTITGNFIGGSLSSCGGSSWVNTGAVIFYGIYLSSGVGNVIDNNTIQNINLSSTASAGFYGIYCAAGDVQIGTSMGNVIGDATTSNSITINGKGSIYGIYAALGTMPIKNNIVANISQTSTKPGFIAGIYSYSNNTYSIELNKVYKLGSTVADDTTTWVCGIRIGSSGTADIITLKNNQIAIGQSSSNNRPYYGILYDAAGSNSLKAYYNSVFVTGTASSATYSSAAIRKTTDGAIDLRNNILYNNRSGNSSANHAIWFYNGGTRISNYNMLVASSAAVMNCNTSTSHTYSSWISTTNLDRHSWPVVSSNITYSNLFTDALNCNLSIRNDQVEAWYAHGNGEVITSISTDFDGNARVNSVGAGVTDIGAFEFAITSKGAPSTLVQTGTIAIGNTTTYALGEKTLVSILWNSGSSLPTAVDIAYHSGEVAADLPNYPDGTYSFAYFDIAQTGGTLFNYNITQYYSDAALSRFMDIASELSITRAQNATDWTERPTDQINTTLKTARITNQTGFGVFAFTAAGEGGLLPIVLASFQAKAIKNYVELDWTTLTESNNDYFNIDKSVDGTTFETIATIKGAGNSNKLLSYLSKDMFPNNGINYYRLKQTDYDGNFSYSKIVTAFFNSEFGSIIITPKSQGMAVCSATLASASKISISVYNNFGQLLNTYDFTGNKGVNNFELSDLPINQIMIIKITNSQESKSMKYFGL